MEVENKKRDRSKEVTRMKRIGDIRMEQWTSIDKGRNPAAAINLSNIVQVVVSKIRIVLAKKISYLKVTGHATISSLDQIGGELEIGSAVQNVAPISDHEKYQQRNAEKPATSRVGGYNCENCSRDLIA